MSKKYCPVCHAVIEFAQCDYRNCDQCGWKGDWTEVVNKDETKKDTQLDTTVDEWRAALEVETGDDLGKTSGELAEELGVSERTIQKRLKSLIKKGLCKQGTAKRTVRCGYGWTDRHVPVYQLVKKEEEEDG